MLAQLLVLLGGCINVASFWRPIWSTPVFRQWTILNYPWLFMFGVGALWMPALIGSLLILFLITFELVSNAKSTYWTFFGTASLICGVGGVGLTFFMQNLFYTLFWEKVIIASSADGFYLLLLADLMVAIGSAMIVFGKSGNDSNNANTKPSTKKASATTNSKASAPSPTRLPLWLLLFWIPLSWFSSRLYAVSKPANQIRLADITVPEGFKLDIYAEGIPDARSMTLSDDGKILFVSTRLVGDLYAVMDLNQDQKADRILRIASGLNQPSGIAFQDGSLYVAEISKISVYKNIQDRLWKLFPTPESRPSIQDVMNAMDIQILNDTFPKDTHHGWKYIKFSPDGLMYIPVGCPCNICYRNDSRYSSILRQKSKGSSDFEIYSHGVRNTVGFDWHPLTKELFFTDNGRDWLSHDLPPDELNRAETKNLHFGFPACFGKNIADPELTPVATNCSSYRASTVDLAPHAAALGMTFYTGTQFPAEFRTKERDFTVFIAEHGSWNSVPLRGYRVSKVTFKDDKPVDYSTFVNFISDHGVGRPADLLQLKDGSMLISDDHVGVIYRLSYHS